jgi:uncharacterized repeat protein (TIGR03806 family)
VVRDGGIARFGIPPDNPFVNATEYNGLPMTGTVRTEFWATGLRNPWRMAFDPITGRLYVGDVGQDAREEVHLVRKGDNCGWNYREGSINGPDAGEAPPGFNPTDPIFEYNHAGGAKSVIGGIVYRGSALPQLYGSYFAADSYDGRVWAISETAPGSGTFTNQVLLNNESGIVAFGEHPGTKDLLIATHSSGQIRQLVPSGPANGTLPQTLSATGAFSDLNTLTPETGIEAYAPNVNFWSDGAVKTRWFSVPELTDHIGWARDANWSFPTGSVWIKHFELRTDLGEPAIWKRLETRFIIKTATGMYGLTYKWNPAQTEAFLVPAEGEDETLTVIRSDDSSYDQVWSYPSRSQCIQCHTEAGGYALSFNTRQLNRMAEYGSESQNQIEAFSQAGYFSNAIDAIPSLPRVFPLDDTTQSLHARARSYFDVNCANCHQPDFPLPPSWNALLSSPFSKANIYKGAVVYNAGNTAARFAIPGDTTNSVVLDRIAGTGPFGRMPPVGSNLRDTEAEALLAAWISSELENYAPYDFWRALQPVDPGEPDEDPDGDGSDNEQERLTRTDPNDPADVWTYDFELFGSSALFVYLRLAGLDFELQSSTNLIDWAEWIPASPSYTRFNAAEFELEALDFNQQPHQYFRFKINEP